jgi:hypothetical protein
VKGRLTIRLFVRSLVRRRCRHRRSRCSVDGKKSDEEAKKKQKNRGREKVDSYKDHSEFEIPRAKSNMHTPYQSVGFIFFTFMQAVGKECIQKRLKRKEESRMKRDRVILKQ